VRGTSTRDGVTCPTFREASTCDTQVVALFAEHTMSDAPFTPNEPILLACNGTRESDAAIHAAADMAAATKRPVTVLAVLEPPPLVVGEYGFVIPVQPAWVEYRDALLTSVRTQIRDVLGRTPEWPIEIRIGDPPTAIAEAAESCGAALIVMGLGKHRIVDRALSSETVLHTLRVARTPVFAVPQSYSSLPTSAIVGVDFSTTAVAAVRLALDLFPTISRLILVHVAPRWDHAPLTSAWIDEYTRSVVPCLERIVRELQVPRTVDVTNVVREGKAARELLLVAEEYAADAIVVGSRGLGLFDRMLVGSTASGIIRGAQVAAFALPLAAPAAQVESAVAAESTWSA